MICYDENVFQLKYTMISQNATDYFWQNNFLIFLFDEEIEKGLSTF